MNGNRTSAWQFRPPLWATLVLPVLLTVTVSAGFWQLSRGEEKRALFEAFDTDGGGETLSAPVANTDVVTLRYRHIMLNGAFDTERQILLDSMLHEGRPGYHVLTPLRTADRLIMVNRGWVPANPDRRVLPDVAVTGEPRTVRARLDRLPRSGLALEQPAIDANAPWPRRLLFPDVAELTRQFGEAVADYQLLLDADAPDGYLRDWRPALMEPERHLGYAVQWFAISLALVVIYMVLNLKRTTRTAVDD